MAISKTQNERPAIIALIDASNTLEGESATHARNIETLTEGLAEEISDREQAVTDMQAQIGEGFSESLTIAQSLSATNRAISTISDEIGDGFSASNTIASAIEDIVSAAQLVVMPKLDALQEWQNRFRLGTTESITVEMGDSVSDTLAFNTPFDDDAEVAVYLVCVDGSEILTDLSCKLISATYSGFSFAVFNDTESDVTIKVGFLAVRMN